MLLGPALGLSAILFSLGVAGVLLRRNAIILAIFRHKRSVDLQNVNLLRG